MVDLPSLWYAVASKLWSECCYRTNFSPSGGNFRSSAGQYFVAGGPSGRFEVHNGLVQPVKDEGVRLPAGLTEQQFYALLQAA